MTRTAAILALLILAVGYQAAVALIIPYDEGKWPETWPKALESLRKQAKTLDVATGTQEHIYTIPFENRDEFEKFWPVLMKVRTPGSPLTLSKVGEGENGFERFVSNAKPCVRIKGPTGAYAGARVTPGGQIDSKQLEEGTMLRAAAPWPDYLNGPKGELPEYVCAVKAEGEKLEWKPLEDLPEGQRGFRNRARVDMELVIDGNVIDLNRVELPSDALIVDKRFPKAAAPAQ
jgi:hypothetical protein